MTADASPLPLDDDLHRRLVDLSSDLLFVADLDGRLSYINDAVTRSLHYSASDLIGREALSLVRDDARDEARAFYIDQTPMRRPASLQEVAAVVRFLMSEEASYMNGTVIPVDGGLTA